MSLVACGVVAFIVYWILVRVWISRSLVLVKRRYFTPWNDAIERGEFDRCAAFEAIYDSQVISLLSWRVVLNPVAWIRYWNWRPKA